MKKLRGDSKLPLILASGKMMRRTPNVTGIPLNTSNTDIAQRVTLLESSFMKQQSEQMRSLTETLSNNSRRTYTVLRPPVFRTITRSSVDSPNKRRRLDDNVVENSNTDSEPQVI